MKKKKTIVVCCICICIFILLGGVAVGVLYGVGEIKIGSTSSSNSTKSEDCLISESANGKVLVKNGDNTQLKCEIGKSSPFNTIKCLNGTFYDENENLVTQALCGKDCDQFPEIKNGNIITSVVKHLESFKLECDKGFVTEEDISFTCTDGKFNKFDNNIQYCKPKTFTVKAFPNLKLSFSEARDYCKKEFGGDLWGRSEKWLSLEGRIEYFKDKGFPDDFVIMGFSKADDKVNYRRVIDGQLVDESNPNPFTGWVQGYPASNEGYDYLYMNHFKSTAGFGLINNGMDALQFKYTFGCEY